MIDPVLGYVTGPCGKGIAVDALGNAYVTGGETDAAALGERVWVRKFSPNGSTVLYTAYLDGSGDEGGTGLALDSSGCVYVTGWTSSADFPTLNAAQAGPGLDAEGDPTSDAFVTKVSAAGSAIEYSTYLGGSEQDGGETIALDNSGNAYVAGETSSTNFPVTAGVLQGSLSLDAEGAGTDAFVTKLSPSGQGLVFSTNLGGTGGDGAAGVAVAADGSVWVAGDTDSANFPLQNPLQAQVGMDSDGYPTSDAFLARLSAAGTTLQSGTYWGGSENEFVVGLALDSSGRPHLGGQTDSMDLPLVNPLQNSLRGGEEDVDSFAARFNPTGTLALDSTYQGGVDYEWAEGLAVSPSGDIYLTGASTPAYATPEEVFPPLGFAAGPRPLSGHDKSYVRAEDY